MNIKPNNYAIQLLKGKNVKIRPPHQGAAYIEDIRRFGMKLAKTPTKVFALSSSFEKSMMEAIDPIMDAWHRDKIQLEKPIQCCILSNNEFCYFVDLRPVGGKLKGRVMQYNSMFEIDSFMILLDDKDKDDNILVDGFCLRSILAKTQEDQDGFFHAAWKAPLCALLYMQFGEIETKYVANDRVKLSEGEYIDSSTSYPVTAVNSTWLNNLVRDKGFKVSGHFRLQRVGIGRSKTKLIWISEYKKYGYNRANDRWREMPTDS